MPIAYSKYLRDYASGNPDVPSRPSVEAVTDLFHGAFPALPSPMLPKARPKVLADEMLVLLENPGQSGIETALRAPSVGLVELIDLSRESVERIEIMAQLDVIGLSVSSRTASAVNLAELLSPIVHSRFAMPATALAPMSLAIHEACINALVHGNLGLKSAYEETGDDLDRYSRLVREKAGSDALGNKRIDILVWETDRSVLIGIRDQGTGYQPMDRRISDPSHTPDQDRRTLGDRRKSGRGLAIVRQFTQSFWLSAPGSAMVMGFDR